MLDTWHPVLPNRMEVMDTVHMEVTDNQLVPMVTEEPMVTASLLPKDMLLILATGALKDLMSKDHQPPLPWPTT